MTTIDQTTGSGSGSDNYSHVAWPGRIMGSVLGVPTDKSCSKGNSRLRYRACSRCANSIGIINVAANSFLMITKGYLGTVGGSAALVADAIHSAADLVSAIMLMFGLKIANRPANSTYPYGYGKVEFLVAVVIYSSLILAGIVIFYGAILTVIHGGVVNPSMITIWGALLSIIINEMMFRQSFCAGGQLKSPSMVANAWEKRSDALSSIAVLIGIIGSKFGFHFMDPLAAIFVAFYILKSSIKMMSVAFKGLLDSSLDADTLLKVRSLTEQVPGVNAITAIRSREIGQVVWIDIDISVNGDLEVDATSRIKNEIKEAICADIGRPANVVIYLKPDSI